MRNVVAYSPVWCPLRVLVARAGHVLLGVALLAHHIGGTAEAATSPTVIEQATDPTATQEITATLPSEISTGTSTPTATATATETATDEPTTDSQEATASADGIAEHESLASVRLGLQAPEILRGRRPGMCEQIHDQQVMIRPGKRLDVPLLGAERTAVNEIEEVLCVLQPANIHVILVDRSRRVPGHGVESATVGNERNEAGGRVLGVRVVLQSPLVRVVDGQDRLAG